MSFAKAKNMQCYMVWHLISHTISCRNYQSEIIRNKEKHKCKAKKSKRHPPPKLSIPYSSFSTNYNANAIPIKKAAFSFRREITNKGEYALQIKLHGAVRGHVLTFPQASPSYKLMSLVNTREPLIAFCHIQSSSNFYSTY